MWMQILTTKARFSYDLLSAELQAHCRIFSVTSIAWLFVTQHGGQMNASPLLDFLRKAAADDGLVGGSQIAHGTNERMTDQMVVKTLIPREVMWCCRGHPARRIPAMRHHRGQQTLA